MVNFPVKVHGRWLIFPAIYIIWYMVQVRVVTKTEVVSIEQREESHIHVLA